MYTSMNGPFARPDDMVSLCTVFSSCVCSNTSVCLSHQSDICLHNVVQWPVWRLYASVVIPAPISPCCYIFRHDSKALVGQTAAIPATCGCPCCFTVALPGMYVCMSVCLYVCMYVYVYVCMYVSVVKLGGNCMEREAQRQEGQCV